MACGYCLPSALAATGPIGGTAVEATIDRRIVEPTPGASRPDKPAAGALERNPLWAVPLKSLKRTRERPLFSPSRRPPPPVAVAAPPAPPGQPLLKPVAPDHPLLTLVGTIVGETQSIGVFVDQVTKDVIRLRTGEGHAGWTLRAIHGREATFEEDQHEATLVLLAHGAPDQEAASVAAPPPVPAQSAGVRMDSNGRPTSPPPPPSMYAAGKPGVAPPSAWLDGDGQSISPPSPPSKYAAAKPGVAPLSTWLDGDGQSAGPPPSPNLAEDGKPLGPSVWLDGYGRPTGPAPTTWLDGDGQSISSPPPYRWLDEDGTPIVPPPPVWRDGDGQLISPPLTRVRQSAQH